MTSPSRLRAFPCIEGVPAARKASSDRVADLLSPHSFAASISASFFRCRELGLRNIGRCLGFGSKSTSRTQTETDERLTCSSSAISCSVHARARSSRARCCSVVLPRYPTGASLAKRLFVCREGPRRVDRSTRCGVNAIGRAAYEVPDWSRRRFRSRLLLRRPRRARSLRADAPAARAPAGQPTLRADAGRGRAQRRAHATRTTRPTCRSTSWSRPVAERPRRAIERRTAQASSR